MILRGEDNRKSPQPCKTNEQQKEKLNDGQVKKEPNRYQELFKYIYHQYDKT